MNALPGEEPTGLVAYPSILIEGEEKAHKTSEALMLSRDPRIGHVFVLELGESKADEYARIGSYRILRHNGTYWGILEQLRAATAVPMIDGKPNVIIFDSISWLWDLEKARVDVRARRGAKANAERYNKPFDPDQEIKAPFNLWSDAKTRWYRVINELRAWEGIVVYVARGKDGIKVEGNKVVENETEWKVQTEGNLKFEVDAWVRMQRGAPPMLMGAGSMDVDVPAQGLALPSGHIKDESYCGVVSTLVFDMLGAGNGGQFAKSSNVTACVGRTVLEAKNGLVGRLLRSCGSDVEVAKVEAQKVWVAAGLEHFPKDGEINDDTWARLCELTADAIAARIDEPVVRTVRTTPEPISDETFIADMERLAAATSPPVNGVAAADATSGVITQPVDDVLPENERPVYVPAPPEPIPPAAAEMGKPVISERTSYRSFGREVNAMTPDVQVAFLKWLDKVIGCPHMAVPLDRVADVEAKIHELQNPPEIDTEAVSGPNEQNQLRAAFLAAGISAHWRYRHASMTLGRTVRSFDLLTVGDVQKLIDSLQPAEHKAAS